MNSLRTALDQAIVAPAQGRGSLHIFPLLSAALPTSGATAADEASVRGEVSITEHPSRTSQGFLRLVSGCDRLLFLPDGQELCGAMQDRVLNTSILAPAGGSIDLPVSCVEAARWDPSGGEMTLAPRIHFAAGRAERIAQVTLSLLAGEGASGDQVDIWAAIDQRASRMNARSATRAHSALFLRAAPRVRRLGPVDGQTGAVFAIGDRIVGVDLFESPALYRASHAKLTASAAVDALGVRRSAPAPPLSKVRDFLRRVSLAHTIRFASCGLGENVRISDAGLTGAALVYRRRMVHLAAYDLASCRLLS